MTIAAFDFDGTITTKDTLIEFIRYTHGSIRLYVELLRQFPQIIINKLRGRSAGGAKERIFERLYRGMDSESFKKLGENFCKDKFAGIIHQKAIKGIENHLKRGDNVLIITASVCDWVIPFAHRLGIEEVISTEAERDGRGILTGKFSTPNCYGEEKVKRLLERYPDRDGYKLIAYGDSSGDRALLEFADEAHFKEF